MRCRGGWYGVGFGMRGSSHTHRRVSEDDLALLILAILEEGPRHGFEVALELEDRSRGRIEADADRVYPLLQYLVDRDLVRGEEVGGKTRYGLTDEGKTWLGERRRRVERVWAWTRRGRRGRGRRGFDEELEATMEEACSSMEAAMREVGRALDDIAQGLFGARCRRGRGRGEASADDPRHRAFGCR